MRRLPHARRAEEAQCGGCAIGFSAFEVLVVGRLVIWDVSSGWSASFHDPVYPPVTQSVTFLFMDIRRAALIACIASILSLLIPVWNAAQQIRAVGSVYPRWWIAPVAVMTVLFFAILPVFYFALYRSEGTLRFSRRLRLLAIAAALVLGLNLGVDLPAWIGSLGREGTSSVLIPERGNWTLGDMSTVFGFLSSAAIIFMMIAVCRHVDEEPDASAPASKFFRVVTRVAVIAWGIWVAFNLCRLVLTPYWYATIPGVAFPVGRTPPPFRDAVAAAARMLLSQASLFIGPYVIWRGSSRPAGGCPSIEAPSKVPTDSLSR